MSHRERPLSDAVADALPRSSGVAAGQRAAGRLADPVHDWDELFLNAPPAEQARLLSLLTPSGILPAQHLRAPTAADRPRRYLNQLFASRGDDGPALRPSAVAVTDPCLDAVQRQAVAAALATPDVCLIQGLPGTGKGRVVAEVLLQAARRGERTLFVAPAAVVDQILERIGSNDAVFCVRAVAEDERGEELPPAVRGFTFAECSRRLTEAAVAHAQERAAQAANRLDALRRQEKTWPTAQGILEEREALRARLADLEAQLPGVPQAVEQDLASGAWGGEVFAAKAECEAARQRVEAALTDVRAKVAERREALDALAPQLESLRPLAEAKQHGSWWTKTYWQATLTGDVRSRLAALLAEQDQAQKAIDDLDQDATRLAKERTEAEARFQAERTRLIAAEAARRQDQIRQEQGSLRARQQELTDHWAACFAETDGAPTAMTVEALHERQSAWRRALDEAAAEAQKVRDWADALAQAASVLPERVAAHANLVAGPPAAVLSDPAFAATTFDRLVVEEADRLTEADFVALARRARCWVLVGNAATSTTAEPPARRPVGEPRSRALRPSAPPFFQRLWDRLHADPTRRPAAWLHLKGRWVCRLRPVADDQQRWVETERVADRPDVELRILALPRTEPALAEVVFRECMSLADAKGYIFRELQELPVEARNRSLEWQEGPDRTILVLSDECRGPEAVVPLADGARERVVGPVPRGHRGVTTAIEFDHAAGWDRDRAEKWVYDHLGVRDLGRTFWLDRPYRAAPELARFLSDLLFDGAYRLQAPAAGGSAYEFVPVPANRPDNANDSAEPAPRGNGPRPARGGAGFELDLADDKHRDRLPSELRASLPARGLVNFLEAQAVIRFLERVAGEAAGAERPRVAVLSPFAAQVDLLRLLTTQASGLAAARLDVAIETPDACVGREFDVVLVSLARSHSHRAVPFGESPEVLELALTRARQRLVVFGDPGTLHRRSQWDGALDHLDVAAAARERAILNGLVRHAPAPPHRPRPLVASEGRRT